jgi:prepilin-type N-terminal cleavage/methylation domain-containing protein
MRRAGLTLVEILVVLVIVAIMLGLTVSIFQGSGRDLGAKASADAVVGLLRQASTHARIEATPLWVVLDTDERSVRAVTRQVLGNWHFESGPGAAQDVGTAWSNQGGSRTNGRLGMGVTLDGSASVGLGRVGPIDPTQGFFVELWVRRSRQPAAQQVLVRLGSGDGLTMDRQGLLTAKLGGQTLRAKEPLPVGVWIHLMLMVVPAGEIRLYTKGALNASRAVQVALPAQMELAIGEPRTGFIGEIDEVAVGQMVLRDRVLLGQETQITGPDGKPPAGAPKVRIHFGPDGGLDPRHHAGPVRFAIQSAAERHGVTVHPGGAVMRESGP